MKVLVPDAYKGALPVIEGCEEVVVFSAGRQNVFARYRGAQPI